MGSNPIWGFTPNFLENEKYKKLRVERIKMEIVLQIETKDYTKVKDILFKDDYASRASIVFKEGSIVNKEGYLCYISGPDEQCKRAMELVKPKDEKTGEVTELAKEVTGKEKDEVINKIKEEEDRAAEGFGNIIG